MEATTSRHIDIDPAIRNGRPRITGTRLTVADVAVLHLRMGLSLEEIAGKYDVQLADAHAAMAYYYDHRAEIDGDMERDAAFVEAFRRSNPSLLKERLKCLGT